MFIDAQDQAAYDAGWSDTYGFGPRPADYRLSPSEEQALYNRGWSDVYGFSTPPVAPVAPAAPALSPYGSSDILPSVVLPSSTVPGRLSGSLSPVSVKIAKGSPSSLSPVPRGSVQTTAGGTPGAARHGLSPVVLLGAAALAYWLLR